MPSTQPNCTRPRIQRYNQIIEQKRCVYTCLYSSNVPLCCAYDCRRCSSRPRLQKHADSNCKCIAYCPWTAIALEGVGPQVCRHRSTHIKCESFLLAHSLQPPTCECSNRLVHVKKKLNAGIREDGRCRGSTHTSTSTTTSVGSSTNSSLGCPLFCLPPHIRG